ncbi:MAG: SMP-30/gluconolactonase/LRE family protein [Bacteroidota bacterium]
MKNLLFSLFCLGLVACQNSTPNNNTSAMATEKPTKQTYQTTGSIERMDPAINELIAEDATIEVLADGFTWSEGPLWISEGQYLLFSDIPPNRIMKWSEEKGTELYLSPSGYTGAIERGGEGGSNGLILDKDGRLVLCQHGDRRMARMTAPLDAPQPTFETIVAQYEGKRFNSPNDAVYDSQGNLYFTDPPYGLEKQMQDPTKEIDFQGVYRYSQDGQLTLISDKITRPNGIGLSPDETTLYIASSDPKKAIWMAFTLNEDGSVAEEQLFYDATEAAKEAKGLPDGLKVDTKGNIWATGPGGVWVFAPNGKVLGKILTGEATSNCAFDDKYQTLYMTCDDYLMRVKL